MGQSCPLCLDPLDPTDRLFFPCDCKYQVCLWCYQRISDGDKRCPKCRRPYDGQNHSDVIEKTSLEEDTGSEEEATSDFQTVRRKQLGSKLSPPARDLRDVRVVRRELCYVVGVPPEVVADEEALKDFKWLGKYGPVTNIIVNRNPNFKAPDKKKSCAIYVTYQNFEDAKAAIMDLDDSEFEGRHLRASYGTTKYCSSFLRNARCQNRTCFYLHEKGRDEDSFTVAQMNQVKETSRGLTCSALLASEFEAADWKDGITSLFGKTREQTIAYFVNDPRGRNRPPLRTVAAEIMRMRNQETSTASSAPGTPLLKAPPPPQSLVIMTPPPLKPASLDLSVDAVHPALRWSGDPLESTGGSYASNDDLWPTFCDLDVYSEVGPVKLPPQQPSSLLEVYVTPADARAVSRPVRKQALMYADFRPTLYNPRQQFDAPPPGMEGRPMYRASYADAAYQVRLLS